MCNMFVRLDAQLYWVWILPFSIVAGNETFTRPKRKNYFLSTDDHLLTHNAFLCLVWQLRT